MRVIICGGGTAGHVTPGIAIADYIKYRSPSSEILFIGRESGEENRLIEKSGYNYTTLNVRGFKRSLALSNISAAVKMLIAFGKARKILREYLPDVTIGTGGYVTWPIIKAAQSQNIPRIIHESNAYPGLTTRALSKSCDKVLLNFDECKTHLKRQDNVLTVGNPLRGTFVNGSRERARKELNISPNEIFILSFGGSGGADVLNQNILSVMRTYSQTERRIRHVHATGRKYFNSSKESYPELATKNGRCRIVPFLNDMPTYMLACDIVISRAGAMTLSEIALAGVSSIIIPSPNVTDNHQLKNAKAYEAAGAAVVIEEHELTPNKLKEEIEKFVTNRRYRESKSISARRLYVPDCTERIYNEIVRLAEASKRS